MCAVEHAKRPFAVVRSGVYFADIPRGIPQRPGGAMMADRELGGRVCQLSGGLAMKTWARTE